MLIHANMPLKFWAEAVNVAVYVHNYCPTSSLDYNSPFKCWHNRQPDVSNLKVFGCICYVHISNQLHQKLDPKARKMIFIGYSEGTKGFKVYNPESDWYNTIEYCINLFIYLPLWGASNKKPCPMPVFWKD